MEDPQPLRPKQAACLVCRRSKIKCDYSPHENKCKRCIQLDSECVRPTFHAGRQKGIKNKRKGLDKALYQIEQAIKRSKSGEHSSEDDKAIGNLQALLEGSRNARSTTASSHLRRGSSQFNSPDHNPDLSSDDDDDEDELDNTPDSSHTYMSLHHHNEESLAIDDAENPLQLLARASNLQLSPKPISGLSPKQPGPRAGRKKQQQQQQRQQQQQQQQQQQIQQIQQLQQRQQAEHSDEDLEMQSFFTSVRVNLDVGDDIDPISMGLVTEDEAEQLFAFFHNKLAHTRWGLDPKIYTPSFTRARSAFLCTSIMAASALFLPSAGALSKRLSSHCKTLAHRVLTKRHKSVEIVLAFMVNVPWLFPGQHSTDDETCWYVNMATTIAIDLSLHKLHVPMEILGSGSNMALTRGDCLDPRTALAMDGFGQIDHTSDLGQRLLRRRERCWIALFVLERGMSLARGRPYTVPVTRIIKDCDQWHRSGIADPMDGHLVSMAVLRRDLDGLLNTVRALCDGSQGISTDGGLIAQSIQSAIERFFDQWLTEWGFSIGTGPQRRLPPYVEILVTHTRLSTYGGVINHPTAPMEVRQFFRTAGLSSAVTVMRAAVQGEAQLQSIPNNTTIMVSFAACFALTLSAYATGGSNLAPSIRNLIEETADVLERIGSATRHRNGLATLYGRYLRHIVKQAATTATTVDGQPQATMHHHEAPLHRASQLSTPSAVAASPHVNPMGPPVSQPPPYMESQIWPGTFQFSSMSDDQIAEVLNQPGNEFDPSFAGLSWEDMNTFDWLSWPNLAEFGS
ncbi:Satratoxin biosynthesis SC1 cluster transcription factor SAT9 [Colletotrichum orbiculare MAFF 240422]|uniref:Satratoxin biosynthesis SC1 cluster transcription factor SAT9 n=1 Tax=Colletotrichum orbiculare (strain 104-T / ATCC 96160 / CBS 514.97 / LARS 414 / MAFF 240422) TaxID=1213857 RepID=N4VVT3_COLOR|nr:Satratoxin biosynthesis SC1 cluster transcription factor SAT9 [Colletotrichum orbiculare MAFF 240422]